MKCNNCGSENSNDNKFCTECGTELKAASESIYCPKCGAENSKDSNFCVNCGSRIQSKQKKHSVNNKKKQQNRTRNNKPAKRLTIIDIFQENKALSVIGLLIVAFIIIQVLPGEKQRPLTNNFQTNNGFGFANSRVTDIASKFICSCGTCGELPLESCDCPTAREEKAFIQSQITAKKSDAEIIKSVNSKYGWIKPQFTNLLSKFTGKRDNGNKSQKANARLASLEDLILIAEHFSCPCGQCGIDELKDCNCNHPRGAKEVKGFIASKIKENAYTVDQIIDLVDKTYGGRKI